MSEIKYAPPTKFTIAPKGTVTSNPNDSEQLEYWIQVSADDQHPEWLRLGTFLERIFVPHIDDQVLVDNLLHLYDNPDAIEENFKLRLVSFEMGVLSSNKRDCTETLMCNCSICETPN